MNNSFSTGSFSGYDFVNLTITAGVPTGSDVP
jgi:hypothetical protein